ncbi:hypothetical protein BDZ91DRAFT_843838 [Kalaharituber pfeilii]|nr:hypothetical protein BDZ91DRAFT_843838 [Kalaharituber pfeilii]
MKRVYHTAFSTLIAPSTRPRLRQASIPFWRNTSSKSIPLAPGKSHEDSGKEQHNGARENQDTTGGSGETAFSDRLAQLTEDALNENPRFFKAALESGEFNFNEELKHKLQEKIANAEFKSANAQAMATANLPGFAGKGTRDIVMARPWTGEESQEDTVLRMLVDAHKPLRGTGGGVNIDLRPAPKVSRSAPQRLAHARDLSTEYAIHKDLALSEEEKAQVSSMFKERFTPTGRSIASVQALTSLADQRIEEARARGQFKNLPRGKPLERDYNADSPFLDTTEYFLNRIIKKQEIVPPWIEKQQDLNRARDVFRSRLRVEWKRHAVRVIASHGGTLEEQIARAERYAAAEKKLAEAEASGTGNNSKSSDPSESSPANLKPFRDPIWLKTELAYHTMAVENLNALTRSYNLLAPELAKKPYFSLERELKACYSDVGPQLVQELINRAQSSKNAQKVPGSTPQSGGLWQKVAGGDVKVYDEQKPTYGFREFWRDLFSKQRT